MLAKIKLALTWGLVAAILVYVACDIASAQSSYGSTAAMQYAPVYTVTYTTTETYGSYGSTANEASGSHGSSAYSRRQQRKQRRQQRKAARYGSYGSTANMQQAYGSSGSSGWMLVPAPEQAPQSMVPPRATATRQVNCVNCGGFKNWVYP